LLSLSETFVLDVHMINLINFSLAQKIYIIELLIDVVLLSVLLCIENFLILPCAKAMLNYEFWARTVR
jgi:hypothetical protein